MNELNNLELMSITGGGLWLAAGLIGLGAFIIGIFDGFTRPIKCNK